MSKITSRFDPEPDAQYAKCKTCGIDLPTVEESNIHGNATAHEAFAKGSSGGGHSIRILNPSRARRIGRAVNGIVDEVIDDAMSKLEDLVYRKHITEAEAVEAIRPYSDFADAWDEYNE